MQPSCTPARPHRYANAESGVPTSNESVRAPLHFPCDDSTLPGGEAATGAK